MTKHFLMPIIVMMTIMAALVSCGSANDTEKKLNGSWDCSLPVENIGSGSCQWDLDASDHKLTAKMSTSLMGIDDCINLTIEGKWSATPDSLIFTVDPEHFDLKINDKLMSQIETMGMSKDEFYKNAEENLRKDFGTRSSMALSDLTDSTFTVTDNHLSMHFTRK
ncbi:MAG: hypothetical protein Q4C34_09170 [Bacteroidales bacterium]|nr:hypothetical protein [Bacteroidales bacterium]